MDLSGIVAVSGKAGLFKVVGQSKAGFILQHLEDSASRVVVNTNARLASLDETTVYGTDHDLPLKEILTSMQAAMAATPVPDTKADAKVQRAYFTQIIPEHDTERVYASDIKKIISWFKMLEKLPLFTAPDPKEQAQKADDELTSTELAPATPAQPDPINISQAATEGKAGTGNGK